MTWDAINAIAEVLGVLAVIVSLAYVATQVRQGNQMALAESERELLENWASAISQISANDRITEIFCQGLNDFNSMTNLEKTRFSVVMARLINTYISAIRMDEKSLVSSQEVNIFGDICFAMIIAPGGRQWWELTGRYFTVHDRIDERIEREGDSFPSWIDMLPYFKPDAGLRRNG
jgi:predicted histidine transporter YuiF (NhaC family)